MKIRQILLAVMSLGMIGLFAQGSIEGNLKDEKGEALSFANISVYQDGKLITGVSSDIDGYYFIDNLREGKYEIVVSGVEINTIKDFAKVKDRETLAYSPDIEKGVTIGGVEKKGVKETYFFIRSEPTVTIKGADTFVETGAKTVDKVLATIPASTSDKEGNISFRGSRPGQGAYYVDGMRIGGKLGIPTSAIYSMKVHNGGVPARYGNTTSAVIVIETKSVFDFFD